MPKHLTKAHIIHSLRASPGTLYRELVERRSELQQDINEKLIASENLGIIIRLALFMHSRQKKTSSEINKLYDALGDTGKPLDLKDYALQEHDLIEKNDFLTINEYGEPDDA